MRHLLALLISAFPAFAGDNDWTKTDTALESACLTSLWVDWRQTRDFPRHEKITYSNNVQYTRGLDEGYNPIMGRSPNPGQVNRYFLGLALAHVVITKWCSPHARHSFQGATLFVEANCIAHNSSLGVRLQF